MKRSMIRSERVSALDYEKYFKDKVCLVTGATSGIGKSVCRKLISAGAFVIMIGRTIPKLERTLAEFKAEGLRISESQILPKNMDFYEPSNVEKDFQNLMLKTKGKLDVLINAAGVVNRKSLKQATLVDWDKTMNLNVRAVFQLMSMSTPFLKDSKGCIVNVSATAGTTPEPGALVFSVSKSMVNMLTKCAALELAGFGVRVNAVAPGFVDTPARKTPGEVTMGLDEGEYNMLKGKTAAATPLNGTIATPDEVADSILWLATPDSGFITGEVLALDGGQTMTTNLYDVHVQDMITSMSKMGY